MRLLMASFFAALISSCAQIQLTPQELNKTIKNGLSSADVIARFGKPKSIGFFFDGNRLLSYDEYLFYFAEDQLVLYTKPGSEYSTNVVSSIKSKTTCQKFYIEKESGTKDSLILDSIKEDLETKLTKSNIAISNESGPDICVLSFTFDSEKVKETRIYSTTEYSASTSFSQIGNPQSNYNMFSRGLSTFSMVPVQQTSSSIDVYYERALKLVARLNGKSVWEGTVKNASVSSDDRKILPRLLVSAASIVGKDTKGEVRDLVFSVDPRITNNYNSAKTIRNEYVLDLKSKKMETPFQIAEILADGGLFLAAIKVGFPLSTNGPSTDPLCIAVRSGFIEGVQALLSKGVKRAPAWNVDQKVVEIKDCMTQNPQLSEDIKEKIFDLLNQKKQP